MKRKTFQLVTNLFHTTNQEKIRMYKSTGHGNGMYNEKQENVSQTFDTPPMCDALIVVIDGRQILDGTLFSPIETPKYMLKVLDNLHRPQIVINRGPISTLLSTRERIQG